jgi:hypothetical protein
MKYFIAFITVVIARSLFEAAMAYPERRCQIDAKMHEGQLLSSGTFRLAPSFLILPTGGFWAMWLIWHFLQQDNRESTAAAAAVWFFFPLLGLLTIYLLAVYFACVVTLHEHILTLRNERGMQLLDLRQLNDVSLNRYSIALRLPARTPVKLPIHLRKAGVLLAHLRETSRQNRLQALSAESSFPDIGASTSP